MNLLRPCLAICFSLLVLGVYAQPKTTPDSLVKVSGRNRTVTYTFIHGGTREIKNYKDDLLDGQQITYSNSGNLLQELTYKQGHQHGPSKRYDGNNHLIEESNFTYYQDKGKSLLNGAHRKYILKECVLKANYVKGTPVGEWLEYYPDGKRKKEAYYTLLNADSSVLDQSFKVYEANGLLRTEGIYKQGKKEGIWKTFQDGSLTELETFDNDKPHGLHMNYHHGAILRSVTYYDKILVDGMIRTNVFDGRCFENYPGGSLKKEESYNLGKRDGRFAEFYENGTLKSESYYKQGMQTGPVIHFDETGKKLFEANYKIVHTDKGDTSLKEGLERKWRNGIPEYTENWHLGKREGLCSYYSFNGNILREQFYVDGQIQGENKEYSNQGKLKSIRTYKPVFKENKLVKSITDGWSYSFNEDGTLTSKMFYHNDEWIVKLSYLNKSISAIEIRDLLTYERNPFGTPKYLSVVKKGHLDMLELKWYSDKRIRGYTFQDSQYPVSAHVMLSQDGKLRHGFFKIPIPDLIAPSETLMNRYQSLYQEMKFNSPFFTDTLFDRNYILHYANGSKMLIMNFEQNIPHGEFVLLTPDQQDTMMYCQFNHGVLIGNEFYKVAGKIPSASYSYYHHGTKKKEMLYSLKGLPASYNEYDESGKNVFYRRYSENGKLQTQNGKNLIDNKEYYPSGHLRYEIMTVAHDTSLMQHKEYYDAPEKLQQTYFMRNQIRHGVHTTYYQNGTIHFISNYADGKLNGSYKEFDSVGKLKTSGHYTNGLAEGYWVNYSQQKKDSVLYRAGKREVIKPSGTCICVDTTESNQRVGFMNLLRDLVETKTVLLNSPSSFLPIDSLNYSKIFYNSFQFSNGYKSGFSSMNIVPLKELSFYYPGNKLFKLCFNPGLVEGYRSKIPLTANYESTPSGHFSLNASLKYMSVEFLTGPIKSTDKNTTKPKAIFSNVELNYEKGKQPEFQCKQLYCMTPVTILNHLQAQVIAGNFFTGSSNEWKEYELKQTIPFPLKKQLQHYGVLTDTVSVSFPVSSSAKANTITTNTATLFLSGQYACGSIAIPCKQLNDDLYSFTSGVASFTFSLQELKMTWLKKGFTQVETSYNDSDQFITLTFMAE